VSKKMAVGKQLYTSYCTELFDTHLPRKVPSYDSAITARFPGDCAAWSPGL